LFFALDEQPEQRKNLRLHRYQNTVLAQFELVRIEFKIVETVPHERKANAKTDISTRNLHDFIMLATPGNVIFLSIRALYERGNQ
tara:strand:- start:156 stop:410 length:255 start_codon:yes stop_codon:yes gene_type:complete